MDEKRFAAAMKALAINSGVELPKDVMTLYFKALKHIPDAEFEKGVKKVLLTWVYNRIPPLAIIVEAINGNKENQLADRAEIQATFVISSIGKYDTVFEDKITKHLMSTRWAFKTWGSQVLESELKWWVKEFKDAYIAFSGPETPLQIEATPDVKSLLEGIG